jgi:hypothetical protein
MKHVPIHYTCACSIDGWPCYESAPHSHACRVLAHRQRPHAIARVRKNPRAYPFTYPDLASMYIYIYIVHDMCVGYTHTCKPSLLRAAIPTHGHTRACARPHVCAHVRARIGGPAAHNGPRRTDDPAERVPPAVARRPGRKGGAYIAKVGDTRGVPRADVRVERRRLGERLRAEATRGPRRRKARARVGADAWAPNRTRTHARAQTQHVRACVRRARIGDPFIGAASRARM